MSDEDDLLDDDEDQFPWEHLCGRAGWMTVCDRCHLQVDFFREAMN